MLNPDLYIVGFQKCASSTLFDCLTRHPSITGTIPKETYYLVDDSFDHYDMKNNIACHCGSCASFIKEDNNLIVEGSVCNFYQSRAIKYIKKNHRAKVIFIVRDPVERFVSVYKYLYGKINGIPAGMTIEDFYYACNEGIFDRHLLKYAVDHGKYHDFIPIWEEELGKDRVFILGMKEMIHNPSGSINSLFDFLEVPRLNHLSQVPHKNKSMTYAFPRVHEKLVSFFGGSILSNNFTKYLYSKLVMRPVSPQKLVFSSKDELVGIYENEYKFYKDLF